jgi:hypothetical protein
MEFIKEMLKDQLHLCKTQNKTFETMFKHKKVKNNLFFWLHELS